MTPPSYNPPPLGFGHNGTGLFGAYAPSSGIVPNAQGITGVTDMNTGSGFHGNEEHFATGNVFKPVPEGYVPFNPEWGVDQNPETGNVGLPSSPPASADRPAMVIPESPLANQERKQTPFLDSYMKAREQAKKEGPVSSMMKKYLED